MVRVVAFLAAVGLLAAALLLTVVPSARLRGGGATDDVNKGSEPAQLDDLDALQEEVWIPFVNLPSETKMKKAREKAKTHQLLREPEVLRGPVTLSFQATKIPTPWMGGYFWTRGYGSIPGPTIRVKPGETLEIRIKNDLGPGPGYEACNFNESQLGFFMNPATICALNHTNLHTHGLHVSPGEDSIFAHIKPGEEYVMTLKIPNDHMPGTHWYHPHLHHATAAQAGGGAHGTIIVDDPPGYLPKFVEDMPEKVMFISLVNVPKAMRLESWGLGTIEKGKLANQTMWKNPLYPEWESDPVNGIFSEHGQSLGLNMPGLEPQAVVNGQWRPKVQLEDGVWYRLRFTFAAIEQRLEIFTAGSLSNAAFCEYQLLAKDGIYLHDAPRPVDRVYLVSGSRADVAVRCTCGFATWYPCTAKLDFAALWQPMGLGRHAVTMESTTDELLHIEVVRPSYIPAWRPPMQKFSVRRPCYLADLRNTQVMERNRHAIDMPMLYPMAIKFDGKGHVWGHKAPSPMGTIKVGEVQEWTISGIRFHPFHLHVNPYQIVEIWNDPYYMAGDWHDTMLLVGSAEAKVRVNIDKFTGKMIAHCHILEHEDNGMMGYIQVEGVEGGTWSNAWLEDNQCYTDRFPGPPVAETPPMWR